MRLFKSKKAQGAIEYAMIFAAVIAAAVLMNNYVKRGINAGLKSTAEGLNDVFEEINN